MPDVEVGLGAVLGFESVRRFSGAGRLAAIAALATLTIVGERRSLGAMIERSRVLGPLDRLGRSRL